MIIFVPLSLEPKGHYDEALNPCNCGTAHDERKSVSVKTDKLRLLGQDASVSLLRYH